MRLGRESQISSIIRISVLVLFGLTSSSSGADGLTCTNLRIVSAVPSFVCPARDRAFGCYWARGCPARQIGCDVVDTLRRCDSSNVPVARDDTCGDRTDGRQGRRFLGLGGAGSFPRPSR